ncbi:hypothetical protein GCM10009665_16510 [Kitasatospora nipponensis]|uniref:Uncharacterized protein n=1 Tax=Kitasatospora nipponensis TaxID=258049 RepID=A0ABP4GJ35_9ACTN
MHTVGEIAQALATAYGGPAPVVTGEYRLGDVRHITADSGRLRAETRLAPAGLVSGGHGRVRGSVTALLNRWTAELTSC